MADCNQVSDKIHDALEELWQRFPEVSYPQERIDRLRDVLSTQLVLIIKRKWLAKDIMQEPFDCIKEDLRCSIQLLEEFKDTMKNLNLTRSLNSCEDKRSHGVVEHPIICEFLGRLQEVR